MPAWSVAMWTRGKAGEEVTSRIRSVWALPACTEACRPGSTTRTRILGLGLAVRGRAAAPLCPRSHPGQDFCQPRCRVLASAAHCQALAVCLFHDDGGAAADEHGGSAAVVPV